MPRSPNTLLLITQDWIARAELRGGVVTGVAHEPRPAVDDLPSLVEAALRLNRRRPGRVWILTSDCWMQVLHLPIEAVARLKPEEVGRALAFEAEPFSSIPALEAAVAQQTISSERDQRGYWLIELSGAQLQQIEEVVQLAGGRLTGLSHPAGLAQPLLLSGSLNWQRIELWPGAVVCTRTTAGSVRSVLVRNSDPRPGRWEEDARLWREEAAEHAWEGLHGTAAVARSELPAGSWLSVSEEAGLAALLGAWAGELQRGERAVPALHPPRRPMSATARKGLSALLALVGLLFCLGHYFLLDRQQKALAEETTRLRMPAQQLAELKKEAEKIKKDQADLRKAHESLSGDLARCRQLLEQQRRRLAAMLGVLADRCPDELIIQRIEGGERGVVLHGTCLQPELVNRLAANLAEAMSPLGWLVQPPGKHSLDHLTDGGPWTFELELQEALQASAASPAAQPSRPRRRSEE